MTRFFFNRHSKIVGLLELAGVVLAALVLWRDWGWFDLRFCLFLLMLSCYLIIRICDWIPWYSKSQRVIGGTIDKTESCCSSPKRLDIGIEVHFKKALVPTSYILFLASLMIYLEVSYISMGLVILADLMMIVVTPVNGIMIYFHFKDKDPMPINYFSNNIYLNEKHPS